MNSHRTPGSCAVLESGCKIGVRILGGDYPAPSASLVGRGVKAVNSHRTPRSCAVLESGCKIGVREDKRLASAFGHHSI